MIPIRLAACLGAAAILLFGWQRLKESYRDEGRQECRDAAIAEYKENASELSRIASKARTDTARLAVDAGAARSASDRLRGAVAGSGLVIRSAAVRGGEAEPVSETERLSAELLRGCVETARFADCLASGGEACEQSYDAVSR